MSEELLLCKWHSILGSHWARITKKLEGRTENTVKNHWNAAYRSKVRGWRLCVCVEGVRGTVECVWVCGGVLRGRGPGGLSV